MSQTPTASPTLKVSKKDIKAEATRARICSAVVDCLDEAGYAETSINRIQERADVSRGALTHHFPTKQDLVAETAMRLLEAALTPIAGTGKDGRAKPPKPTELLLRDTWNNVANTREGRAFIEILTACRTDQELHGVLAERLHDWDTQSAASIMQCYRGSSEAPDDAALVWSICRAFFRGLLIHERFVADPDFQTRMLDRFAGIMKDHLLIRTDLDQD